MITITIRDRTTGKTRTLRGTRALVLVRDDGDDVTVCAAGHDEGTLCDLLSEAAEHVQGVEDPETVH